MAVEATNHTPPDAAEIEDLIACPHCDALYVATM